MPLFNRFFLAFLFCAFTFQVNSLAQTAAFSADQKALLEAALRTAVSKEKNLEDYGKLADPEKIILLDKMVSITKMDSPPVYITEEVLPRFDNVKFDLKSEAEIFKKRKKKDLLFLRVAAIDQPDTEYAVVSVLAQWHLGKKSYKKGFRHKDAQAYSLLFRKIDGNWQFQKILTTFPNLIDFNPGF